VIRLGLLSFSDGRERVHDELAPVIQKHELKIKEMLEATGEIQVVVANEIAHSADTSRQQARKLANQHLDGIILNLAVFAFPNYVVLAAQEGRGPYLLVGPHDSRFPGLTGLLASGGALNQVGIQHERLWVDSDDQRFLNEVMTFGRAAAAATRLRGQVYGLVGGRSIGMYTGAPPAELWQRLFGVDVDHVDQSEIVRLAPLVSTEEVELAKLWLKENLHEIVYDGDQLTPEKLDFQLRCYIALKEIVSKHQFDFIGLKCHYDMSEFFSVQCLSAAFLNDPYDWLGPKDPIPLACEADSDGALTMQLLSLVSGKPSCLLDLRFFDQEKKVYVMPNCGAVPTWFAARSNDPSENLANVRIVPSISKYAGGGAHIEFVFAKGELTLARLTRSPEGYRMIIMKGETEKYPLNDVIGANPKWPHAFVRLNNTPAELVNNLQSNHIHAVAGDYQKELIILCRILNIQSVVLDN
jgi:L-fucose/D-arabinose isomerase